MRKIFLVSCLVVLSLVFTSCISATLADYLPPSHDHCPIHPIDAILFSYPQFVTENLKEPPALHIYNTMWSKTSFINLEPFERPKTELEQTIYLTAKRVQLWNQNYVVMNQEPYLDFYSIGGDFEKRIPITIKDSKNLRTQFSATTIQFS